MDFNRWAAGRDPQPNRSLRCVPRRFSGAYRPENRRIAPENRRVTPIPSCAVSHRKTGAYAPEKRRETPQTFASHREGARRFQNPFYEFKMSHVAPNLRDSSRDVAKRRFAHNT
jgi:hypothetical protein